MLSLADLQDRVARAVIMGDARRRSPNIWWEGRIRAADSGFTGGTMKRASSPRCATNSPRRRGSWEPMSWLPPLVNTYEPIHRADRASRNMAVVFLTSSRLRSRRRDSVSEIVRRPRAGGRRRVDRDRLSAAAVERGRERRTRASARPQRDAAAWPALPALGMGRGRAHDDVPRRFTTGNVRDVRSRHVRRDQGSQRRVIDCANRSRDFRISRGAQFRQFDRLRGRSRPRARCDVQHGRGSTTVGSLRSRDATVRCFGRNQRVTQSSTLTARVTTIHAKLERFPLSIIQLAMRIGVGAAFFRSGLLKVNSWEFAVQLFRDEYKVPLLDPVLAAQLQPWSSRRALIPVRWSSDPAGSFATARDDCRDSDLRLPQRMERSPAVGLDTRVPVDARPRRDIAGPFHSEENDQGSSGRLRQGVDRSLRRQRRDELQRHVDVSLEIGRRFRRLPELANRRARYSNDSMVARFGTAREVTRDELRVGMIYPADEIAEALFRDGPSGG